MRPGFHRAGLGIPRPRTLGLCILAPCILALGLACSRPADEPTRPANEPTATGSASEAPRDAAGAFKPSTTGSPDGGQGSPEARFLAEFSAFTAILAGPTPPGDVVAALEAHYARNQQRIDAAVQELGQKRRGMSDAELQAFEDRLSGSPEATAFFEAFEAFEARATAAELERLDAILAAILALGDPEGGSPAR